MKRFSIYTMEEGEFKCGLKLTKRWEINLFVAVTFDPQSFLSVFFRTGVDEITAAISFTVFHFGVAFEEREDYGW